jgi:hypothetical protein
LPYAAEAGSGSAVYLYFLFLGHMARWTGLPLIALYHAVRALFSVAMMLAAFLLFIRLLPDRKHVWAAYWLTLIGSGVGWMGVPFGLVPADLAIPESIPFLMAYVNAHFPLTATAFLAAVLASADGETAVHWRVLLGVTAGLTLGVTLPFVLASLLPIIFLWLSGEALLSLRRRRGFSRLLRRSTLSFGAVVIGALPWIGYYYWLTVSHPAIAAWSAQNLTPSPPPIEYLLGYGLVLALALVGAIVSRLYTRPEGRLLIVWVCVTAIVLYAPFGLQRRANLGLYFALAAMAAYGIHSLANRRISANGILVLVLLLSMPSHLLVMASGLAGVARGEALLVISKDDLGAFEWLANNAGRDALVLASPLNGNRIPAFASVRVVYGHPMETPKADEREAWVESLYAWDGSELDALRLLNQEGIDYVLLGDQEREIGDPDWLQALEVVYRSGGTSLYGMISE